MDKEFIFWSDSEKEAMQELHPDLGLRDWDQLSYNEKEKIWFYMEIFFSDDDNGLRGNVVRKFLAINCLNEKHKYRSYGINFLKERSVENASIDFKNIFISPYPNRHVFFELISCFCRVILEERCEIQINRKKEETDEEYIERFTQWRYQELDQFIDRLNDVFEHFCVSVVLTRHGFIQKQENEIIQKIYNPVLKFLSNEKWKPVSRDIKDAFSDFQIKSSKGYSSCITHSVSAIEAYLQILVYGKTGKNTVMLPINQAEILLEVA